MTYIMQNSVKIQNKVGPPEIIEGIYIKFQGNPPEFNSEVEAKRYAIWEMKRRIIKSIDLNKRTDELDKQIQAWLEAHEDYILGKIEKKDPQELLRKFGINKCVLCTTGEPRVFQNEELLAEHLRFEHGIKKTVEKPKESEPQPEAN